ncbi:MAG: MarR family transcriptional regulator [Thermomicrobiales bacterium]|nr:MarR family transcriptional regulator [Thermomicrobiales bacterium]
MRRSLIDIDDHRALAEFRYQIRKFLSFSERAAREAGIEPQQHQLLLALTGLPDGTAPTIGELADRLQIQHHSTVELVSRLAKREMVRRTRNPADRRQVFVELTDEGHAIMAQLSAVHLEELNRVGPELARALSSIVEESAQVAPSRSA